MNVEAHQSGFSLLESVVALAILATSGIALFSWISQSYASLIHLEEVQARQELAGDLHAFFSTVNVRSEGVNRVQINGYDVVWTASLAEPVQRGRSTTGGLSNFDLGLYDIDIEVASDQRVIGQYQTAVVGYTRIRNVNEDQN